jgi:DeoR/GlpR family transcriptional regulator of sugar metabolism
MSEVGQGEHELVPGSDKTKQSRGNNAGQRHRNNDAEKNRQRFAKLTQPNLTIVTNNLSVPGALSVELGAEVYLLGGQFRPRPQVTIGPVAPTGIQVAVDTAIIGIGGLTVREGLSTTILEEASMIAAMIAAARRTIVLADSSG